MEPLSKIPLTCMPAPEGLSPTSALRSPSGLRLGLCVSLPLALAWSLPFGHGISVEAFPLMVGLLVAGLIGTLGLGRVPRGALAWIALVMGAVMWRGSSLPLYELMLFPVGLAVWIGLALGDAAWRDVRVARAIGVGLAAGLAVNFVAAVLQFFHLETHFRPWLTPGGWSIGSDRAYGNLRQANHLGMFFALSLAPLWWMAARRVLSPGGTAIGVASASLVIALSGSRIGVLSVFAVALMAGLWRRSLPERVLPVFLAAPLLVLLFSWGMDGVASWAGRGGAGVLSRDAETVSLRLFHWKAALEMIAADPWWGVGWREFRHARFLLHPQDTTVEVAEHAHNLFLHLAAELGMPLMLLILVPVLAFLVRARPGRMNDPAGQAGWLALLLLFLYSQVEFPLWVMNFQFLAAVAAGLVLASRDRAVADPKCEAKRWALPRSVGWLLSVATLAALVDYDRTAAPTDQGALLDWGSTPAQKVAAARETLLFHTHVDMMTLPAMIVSEANHRQVLAQTEELMHFGPEGQLLAVRLLAACLGEDLETVRTTERAYRLGFPAHYAEFREDLAPQFAARCGLGEALRHPGDPEPSEADAEARPKP